MNHKKKDEIVKSNLKIQNIVNTNVDICKFIKDKNTYFQEIIQNTILSVQNYKQYEIFSNSDVNICISTLNELYEKTIEIVHKNINDVKEQDKVMELLQQTIDKLSVVFCGFGTRNFDDLLFVCFGSQYKHNVAENEYIKEKIELIRKYFHPTGYKTLYWKKGEKVIIPSFDEFVSSILCSNKLSNDIIQIEQSNHYECFDIEMGTNIKFYNKVYGARVVLQNMKTQKTIIVSGILDNVIIDCISNKYIEKRKREIIEYIPENANIDSNIMNNIIKNITLKDLLIYGNEDIQKKYISINADVALVQQNKLEIIIKKFMDMDSYTQRNMLINLMTYNNNDSIQYITYLLYDLITANNNDNTDSIEQTMIYDSFPWKIKMQFKEIMKFTIKYTQDMIQKYDTNRVSLEQQIYLLKVPEYIKEKAMLKLKEIKGKSDESGTKAKQYLEGLLKIPFDMFKEEPILKSIKKINENFNLFLEKNAQYTKIINKKTKYTNIEILQALHNFDSQIDNVVNTKIREILESKKNPQITVIYKQLYDIVENDPSLDKSLLKHAVSKCDKIDVISNFMKQTKKYKYELFDMIDKNNSVCSLKRSYNDLHNSILNIETQLNNVSKVLDDSIHGHDYAKNQILKIIGQWMNGEQTGYCFGFEGSPGVGKTSLAKRGLSHCLIDVDGKSHPFAFIALGGSCNGSTLEGHSYTYVNSIWGRITDILMETGCMNPIIYIDELDKVSKTEHGKEIIGILTHLIDTTQNDCFQDKYYSGINLDLSKALFIFSYNDPENIDRILLDRIHRIRFDNLSLDDKMIIVKKHILPEINEKMGFCDSVVLDETIIEHIIETYTLEPGVRKLKEVLFDLYGEINLELLRCTDINKELPIVVLQEDLEKKYLKKYHKIQEQKIYEKNSVGIINGLWANALGKGGIIPIETVLFPSSTFLDLRLTGLQGDVMKESMNVAKSLAWKLTSNERKTELLKLFEETKCQGLHIHCPQGAVSKDGPSAGTAITVAIYSLFNNKKIKNTIAITGEINLQGKITAIGGLDAKILGGIRGGVKTFLYPKENAREYLDFSEKYSTKSFLDDIHFIEIENIEEVFNYVFE